MKRTQQLVMMALMAGAAGMMVSCFDDGGTTMVDPTPQPQLAAGQPTDGGGSLLQQLNNFRASKGLGAVSIDSRLQSVAQAHTADMASRGRLGHDGSDGSQYEDRLMRAGFSREVSLLAIENVAAGPGGALQVMNMWTNSSAHNRNMTQSAHTKAGIGNVGNYWTLILANP